MLELCPPDRSNSTGIIYTEWLLGFCVVDFDIEYGQSISVLIHKK